MWKNLIDLGKRWNKMRKVKIDIPRPLIKNNDNNIMGGIDLCDCMI